MGGVVRLATMLVSLEGHGCTDRLHRAYDGYPKSWQKVPSEALAVVDYSSISRLLLLLFPWWMVGCTSDQCGSSARDLQQD